MPAICAKLIKYIFNKKTFHIDCKICNEFKIHSVRFYIARLYYKYDGQ